MPTVNLFQRMITFQRMYASILTLYHESSVIHSFEVSGRAEQRQAARWIHISRSRVCSLTGRSLSLQSVEQHYENMHVYPYEIVPTCNTVPLYP